MKAFIKELELISLIDNNYEHIQQLETLGEHYRLMKQDDYSKNYPNEYTLTQEQIDKLFIIARTTQNAHYDMRLFTSEEFKNTSNIISNVLKEYNIKPITSFKQKYYDTLH